MHRTLSTFAFVSLLVLGACSSSTSSGAGPAESTGGSSASGGNGGTDAAGGNAQAGSGGTTSNGGSGPSLGSGCSIVGTFTGTSGTGGMSKIVALADGTFTLSVTSGTFMLMITGTYVQNGDSVTMTNTTSSPSSVMGCIGEAATYDLTWNADCSQITFHKSSDTCTGRIADADGTTLTRAAD